MILCKYICECTLNGHPQKWWCTFCPFHHFTIIYYTVQKSVARVAWAVCVSSSGQRHSAIPLAPICERAEDFLNCLHRAITKNRRKTLAPLIKGSCDLIYVNYSAIVPVRENTPLAQRLFFNIASTSSSSSTLASIPTTGQKCGNIEIRK